MNTGFIKVGATLYLFVKKLLSVKEVRSDCGSNSCAKIVVCGAKIVVCGAKIAELGRTRRERHRAREVAPTEEQQSAVVKSNNQEIVPTIWLSAISDQQSGFGDPSYRRIE